jgi:hypothetical protein
LTLTKGETIQLAATSIRLGQSSDGAMKLLKNTLSVCKEQDAAEKAQQTIVKGFRTDEYKMLSEKVQQRLPLINTSTFFITYYFIGREPP